MNPSKGKIDGFKERGVGMKDLGEYSPVGSRPQIRLSGIVMRRNYGSTPEGLLTQFFFFFDN